MRDSSYLSDTFGKRSLDVNDAHMAYGDSVYSREDISLPEIGSFKSKKNTGPYSLASISTIDKIDGRR